MTLQGGPCTVMRKRRGQSAVWETVCGDTISGAWYAGPNWGQGFVAPPL